MVLLRVVLNVERYPSGSDDDERDERETPEDG